MKSKEIRDKIDSVGIWNDKSSIEGIPQGDMPQDTIKLYDNHIKKAKLLFPELLKDVRNLAYKNRNKIVISICGGSGVGKTGVAALLTHYFNNLGIGSYTMSGDNYPHRIPMYNDAERLGIYRKAAIQGLIRKGNYSMERFEIIHTLQKCQGDLDKANVVKYPWLREYIDSGITGLQGYLGTDREINFMEVNDIINKFKKGSDKIWLKRLGRENTELWYEAVDMSEVHILIIDWTHGNSEYLEGIDIPVLLNSTPKETEEFRKSRNRGDETDTPFIKTVLEIEQEIIKKNAGKAKYIVSKQCEFIDQEQFREIMSK